jgi:tRNA (guanine-N7-)-methyltransferase
MAREKMRKFAELADRANVLQPGKPIYEQIKGNWRKEIFGNDHDIVLELACGRGEYSTGLAAVYPNKNFIGVDIKGDRLWYGSNVAIQGGLSNVAFLRAQIQHLPNFFEEGEVSEIWVIHPDPQPKKSDVKHRLSHPRFLDLYRKLCRPEALIHLKTDNRGLFDYTLEVLAEQAVKDLEFTHNLYESPMFAEHYGITTRYERMFREKGHSINYLKFRFIS